MNHVHNIKKFSSPNSHFECFCYLDFPGTKLNQLKIILEVLVQRRMMIKQNDFTATHPFVFLVYGENITWFLGRVDSF